MKILFEWFGREIKTRPWWMNVLFLFCFFMTFIYCPWDVFMKPVSIDQEVWFGVMFHGAAAKVLAVPHWFVYVAGYLGFKKMSFWMWPWASIYVAQVAISFSIWPLLYTDDPRRVLYSVVGGLSFLFLSASLWKARRYFQNKSWNTRERYGNWVLVTGASSGIGKCFAKSLAMRGHSVVLVARRKKILQELAENFEKEFSIETRVVAADLTREDEIHRLIAAVNDLQIGILINNAGVGYEGHFDSQDSERLENLVRLNCLAPVTLTKKILPSMTKLQRGAVIFVGSVAGSQPLPLHAIYASSKSFNNLLGEALWGELRSTGIDVLSVLPGTTETDFAKHADQIPRSGISAGRVVEEALEALSFQPSVIVGWFNWLRANAGYRILSRGLLVSAAKQIMKSRSKSDL